MYRIFQRTHKAQDPLNGTPRSIGIQGFRVSIVAIVNVIVVIIVAVVVVVIVVVVVVVVVVVAVANLVLLGL